MLGTTAPFFTFDFALSKQALAVALNTVGAVSIKRTHEILSGVFNIPIATDTISNMVSRCADSLKAVVSEKRKHLKLTFSL